VAVVVIGFLGWSAYNSSQEAQSQSALSQVIAAYGNAAGYASDEERYLAVVGLAEQVEADHPDSDAAAIASYFAALSREGLGDVDAAEAGFRGLIATGNESVVQLARYALAESYKKRGDLEAAITVFQALAETGEYEGAVLIELGQLHEALSQPGEARGYYETLLSDYPDSPFRADADRALKRLGEAENLSAESQS
jgi:TolA-binding protein